MKFRAIIACSHVSCVPSLTKHLCVLRNMVECSQQHKFLSNGLVFAASKRKNPSTCLIQEIRNTNLEYVEIKSALEAGRAKQG